MSEPATANITKSAVPDDGDGVQWENRRAAVYVD